MKVLMISGDPAVSDPKTEAGKRTEEYRRVLGELDILLCRGDILSFILGFFRGAGLITKKKPDVITAQDMEHAFLAWTFSKIFRIPWQMQIHTDIMSPSFSKQSFKNKIRVFLAGFLIPRAAGIRVVSERIKKSLDLRFDIQDSRIAVLPVFVDAEKIRNAPIKTDLHRKYGRDKFIILMASRIAKEKNIGLAIEALNDISKSSPDFKNLLLIVGDGPEKDILQRQAAALGLEKSIKFESRTDDLPSYYKTSDLFLLTSNYEGYGMSLVEASAAGAKIISSDVGIAGEILSKEAVFEAGDKEVLKLRLMSAADGRLPLAKPPAPLTKSEYLKLYKSILEICAAKSGKQSK